MTDYSDLLEKIVRINQKILPDNLVGIYLHGSAAMGGFHPEKSDIDLLIVVKKDIPDEEKRRYMNNIIQLNELAPEKGIELSIVTEAVCHPFIYPTPFLLHFSKAYLKWYQKNPSDYIKQMKGTDKDLAAHFTIIYHRGKKLYGKAIKEVFSEVPEQDYFDSIWLDIKEAKLDILKEPIYITLNLCRVMAFKQEKLILSKQEGGKWGIQHLPHIFQPLILEALRAYEAGEAMNFSSSQAVDFANYIIEQLTIN